MEAFSLTLNIFANSWSNLTTKTSFGILRMSWFRNWPWLLNLIKNWLSYWQSKRRLPIQNRPVFNGRACNVILNFGLFQQLNTTFIVQSLLSKETKTVECLIVYAKSIAGKCFSIGVFFHLQLSKYFLKRKHSKAHNWSSHLLHSYVVDWLALKI